MIQGPATSHQMSGNLALETVATLIPFEESPQCKVVDASGTVVRRSAVCSSDAKPGNDSQLGSGNINSVASLESQPYSSFSHHQKMQITVLVSLASLFSPMSATIYVPALPAVAIDLDVSVTLVNLSVTSYMIFQGLSPSVWGSLTDVVGRRSVYIVTLLIYIGACLGLCFTPNYIQLIIFRCLQSTGSASSIAIGAGVIGDMTERKDRGGYIGFYSAGALIGNALGPVLGGLFAQSFGWRSSFYFLTAFSGTFLILLVFVLPETLRSIVGNGSIAPRRSVLHRPIFKFLSPKDQRELAVGEVRKKNAKIDLLRPVKMMLEADVFCALIFTAFYYTLWQVVSVSSATQFHGVYGLGEIAIGLCFVANGVGAVLGSLLTGKLLNRDYGIQQRRERLTASNIAGTRVARAGSVDRTVLHIEHARLRSLPISVVLHIACTVAFGWSIEARASVAVPIVLTFFLGYTTTAIMSTFSTLIIDWYPAAGASATAAINLTRCLLGAGGVSVIQPMIEAIGVGWTFTVCGAIAILCLPFLATVYFKGETFREKRERKALGKDAVERKPETPEPIVVRKESET